MVTRRFLGLFFLFFFSFGHTAPVPQAEMKAGQKAVEKRAQVFALISAGAARVQSLSSDFRQERHLSMLKEPLISQGKFAFEKPDRLYWEILKPSPMGFVVQGDIVRRWNGNSGAPETLEVNQDPMIRIIIGQVLAWTRADFPWLEKRYRITVGEETPSFLKLVPLSSQEKKFLPLMTITFAEDWTHVRLVELHEKGGDFTRLRFTNTLLNPTLPKDLFVR